MVSSPFEGEAGRGMGSGRASDAFSSNPIPTLTLGNRSLRCSTSRIPALVPLKGREFGMVARMERNGIREPATAP